VKTYVTDVNISHTREEGAHSPSWPNGLIIIINTSAVPTTHVDRFGSSDYAYGSIRHNSLPSTSQTKTPQPNHRLTPEVFEVRHALCLFAHVGSSGDCLRGRAGQQVTPKHHPPSHPFNLPGGLDSLLAAHLTFQMVYTPSSADDI
jgi:hypothetical protein